MRKTLAKSLGPGLLFAGAAIGVSHLVQSTKAGGIYGFGLLWALIFIHIIKYPFFEFGPRYAASSKESLLEGYKRLGPIPLPLYFCLNLINMFTIQAAVTIVTAGIASRVFNLSLPISTVCLLVSAVGLAILILGKYKTLDKVVKIIVILLSLSTVLALVLAYQSHSPELSIKPYFPTDYIGITFFIAFLGWMPAPLDISIWHSLWSNEKKDSTIKTSLFDFKVGYIATLVLGCCFLALGAFVIYGNGTSLSPNATGFAEQLIEMYSQSLGSWSFYLIGAAALTAMFSTTLTTLDASPRAMARSLKLLGNFKEKKSYITVLISLVIGTQIIILYAGSSMTLLIKVATILSFLSAPFYAICNLLLVKGNYISESNRPGKSLIVLSYLGILFMIGFSLYYLYYLIQ